MQIKDEILSLLKRGKNLLAFSYGSDSSALFYLLMQNDISFDLALINYKTRVNSDKEENEARKLALKFQKQIFIKTAPKFKGNFEKEARDFRYDFFHQICLEKSYDYLILAHHLNDQFEWFLMQLSRGAGLAEILGMSEMEKHEKYCIIRPLLCVSKNEILNFLKENEIFYFNDESNDDVKYFRNYIRKEFSNSFVEKFSKGLKRSFDYLSKDRQKIYDFEKIQNFKGILVCLKEESMIAKALKIQGVVPSAKQRVQMLKSDCVISGKIAIVYKDDKAFVFNYEFCEKLPKNFKEECRKAKIPRLLRAYLYNHNIEISSFKF
ncbi:tRNA lysidine(34) synthetase TilS [Campylobacter jejuni]|uniref:tRNA lysidine(34) synthetase TilS n=1 Tax=Campylobacter jejuni TaxID=197 RepID=UPI000F80B180|nr:tRNA lysidine(34) synthetase TilS [Campylobacter jejuni]MCW1341990.1 tRNA lysidine(34) synthetase TilS [Campylobacter jejuni]RTI79975.1 tRNA lysidine(34) synthetase TilS [Campylobacter jejuni]RTI98489.1 tRNA lysidine(34) synthetase TilS [Campylobacter jejuni]RTJ03700.1 tRNA lysidine(34) synthetase TilS [Campylobacter jejuni]RTJ66970.1 tRNA lysidine(34) synthetase TilS [Campylobacter jejuni]